MNKALLLRLHRWITLLFAAPLVVVIGTGLVLSFEPVVHHTKVKSGSLTPERVDGLLARHDPQGRARAIAARPYEDTILIQGVRPGPPVAVDLASGEEARGTGRMTWSD